MGRVKRLGEKSELSTIKRGSTPSFLQRISEVATTTCLSALRMEERVLLPSFLLTRTDWYWIIPGYSEGRAVSR